MENSEIFETGIGGLAIEPQPLFGDAQGAVLHMVPGGTGNPEVFPVGILDIYASMAVGEGKWRGGHCHRKLDEFFFMMAGRAAWLFLDLRPDSPTAGRHYLCAVSSGERSGLSVPEFALSDGRNYRLRVPAGIYHAYAPLDGERVMVAAVGSTAHDASDYEYPDPAAAARDGDSLERDLSLLGLKVPGPLR